MTCCTVAPATVPHSPIRYPQSSPLQCSGPLRRSVKNTINSNMYREGLLHDDLFSTFSAMLNDSSNEWSNALRRANANQGTSVAFYYWAVKVQTSYFRRLAESRHTQLFLDLSRAALRLSCSKKCCTTSRFRWDIAASLVFKMRIDEPNASVAILAIYLNASP